MVFQLRQELRLTQQLIMTPQLQMAIKLLQLNRLELVEKISQELSENPALEEMGEAAPDEGPLEPVDGSSADTSPDKEVRIEDNIQNDIDWSNYLDEYNSFGRTGFETEKRDAPQYESFIAGKETLKDHLLWQLLMISPSEEEKQIGSLIIGSLNKDGYLEISLEEIVEMSKCLPEQAEAILAKMQVFDPIGVCARDLSECLLIQVKHFAIDDPVVINIIKNHINHLETKNYKAICRTLKLGIKDIVAAVNIIQALEPKPGREFFDEEPQYISPDIYVYKFEDEFVIMLNDNGMPKLRINPYYKRAIKNGGKITGETKDYLQDKMRSASWLIRSIHQRQRTIYKVMESILKFQSDFFENGISCLKPMVLRDVAQDISMHESTVSRVTSNKYTHTPQGIFELKYFFNSSISRIHGEAVSSASVQEKIRKIIENENSKKPFSDEKISKILSKTNIDIARRTVAKYRDILGILSSSKRKQF